MFTDREFQSLLNKMQQMVTPLEARVEALTKQVEELQNAKVQGPKTSTGGRKRVQQAKADA